MGKKCLHHISLSVLYCLYALIRSLLDPDGNLYLVCIWIIRFHAIVSKALSNRTIKKKVFQPNKTVFKNNIF